MNISLSVVVTTYNDEAFIEQALHAVAQQSYSQFDVAVVDDGSDDGTSAIASAFCDGDERFHYHRKPNGGASRARNYGVAQTTGDWIALCDGDDFWAEDKLEKQLAFIRANERAHAQPLIAVGASLYHAGASGKSARKLAPPPDAPLTPEHFARLRRNHALVYLPTSTLIFKRKAFEQVGGYDPEDLAANDVSFTTRLAEHGLMLNLPEHLATYRLYGESLTDDKFTFQRVNQNRIRENARRRAAGEPELSYEAYLVDLKKDERAYAAFERDTRSRFFYRRASVALLNGNPVAAARYTAQAALYNPAFITRKVRRYLRLGQPRAAKGQL